MIAYLLRRFFLMLITIFLISIIAFMIIQLPPGDYLSTYIENLRQSGIRLEEEMLERYKELYGLDQSIYVQYLKWASRFVRGDMGYSLAYESPVADLVWGRIGLTFVITLSSILFTWLVAFPVGVFSALNQHSVSDYLATFISFIGLAVPNFMLALILMYVGFKYIGVDVGGLFSPEFENAPWSFARLGDFLAHLWVPTIVVGTAGTAGLVRIMRANLLDELKKPYVITARAKGVPRTKVILKYPVRIALNPFISTVGWMLPRLISGATITSVVLNLPTTGPLLLNSLMSQDMHLAASFIMLLSILTVIGTFISDLLLAVADPRIRLS